MNTLSHHFYTIILLCILQAGVLYAQDQPPHVTAAGDQLYCPGTPMNIVTSFDITDPDDTGTDAIYIQISSGYVNGQDMLSLPPGHPNITATWNAVTAKLALVGIGGDVPYADLIAAVSDVVYTNTSASPSGTRSFSITVGEANYLPSTGHYYHFIPQMGITWTASKTAAAASNYYGLQGYLATLASAEEAQIAGEQASGNGWIGGSDSQTEGVWRWMTGPEEGTIFWNGTAGGSSPNFAFWNTSEPNNAGEEDYAHVTAPGVGVPGSWNDLPDGGSSAPYVPQGYIVEYGGMPGDPELHISASTVIRFAKITSSTPASRCGDGTVTLSAISNTGSVYWYAAATGGTEISTDAAFITPTLTTSTIYYVSAYDGSCTTAPRIAVMATINPLPTVTVPSPTITACEGSAVTLQATPSAGVVTWYDALTGGNAIGTGNSTQSPTLTADVIFYAEASNNGCTSATRTAVALQLNTVPVVGPDENVVFCDGSEIDLDAGITGVTYLWSTEETSQTITIIEPGIYTVEVTNPYGCSAVRTFTATALTAPEIRDVIVKGNEAVIIMANNDPENYRFAVDNMGFQDLNRFGGLANGYHTASVLSRNGCGENSYTFIVYVLPKFFTPNGDSINDLFTLDGFPDATIDIFDRYGKLVTQLGRRNRSWDGTYNGQPLPATDYWYVVKIDDFNPAIRGHFTLMR